MLARVRIPLLCLSLLLVAAIVSAETIRFDPPNPTGSRSVDAIVAGVWPNACLPLVKSVVIAATTITLHFDAKPPLGVLCAQSTGPYTRTFHMGIAPPGGYTVILVADAGTTSTELARAPLIVRDAETLSIGPYAVPITGGSIFVENIPSVGGTITIGGNTVPLSIGGEMPPWAIAPPHAAGAVDVRIDTILGTVTAKAALIYYDPNAADPAVFEPILFPVSFQGPGALGSQWLTENFISGPGQPLFRDPLPCSFCYSSLGLWTQQLINDGNPWGHVLYAMRGTTSDLELASRIRDTSRQGLTAGTEVPIARERDFRSRLRFANIPADARFRATLRLWSLSGESHLIATIDSIPAQQISVPLTLIPGTSMSFGSADVTALVAKGIGNPTSLAVAQSIFDPLDTPAPKMWGILSITNNDTQQVTIVSPQ